MSNLIVTEYVTVDGITEGFEHWFFPFWDDEIGKVKHDELFASDTLLYGRVTYDIFAAQWQERTSDVAEAVARLKAQAGGDILVAGSSTLVETLRQHDLVDEYRLMVFPVLWGKGKRFFPDGNTLGLRLVDCKIFGSGVTFCRYQPDKSKTLTPA